MIKKHLSVSEQQPFLKIIFKDRPEKVISLQAFVAKGDVRWKGAEEEIKDLWKEEQPGTSERIGGRSNFQKRLSLFCISIPRILGPIGWGDGWRF